MEHRATVRNEGVGVRWFTVTVTFHSRGDRGAFLRMAASLHRRGIDIASARLADCGDGRRSFQAAFAATPAHAATVQHTLRNIVGVAEVTLAEGQSSSLPAMS